MRVQTRPPLVLPGRRGYAGGMPGPPTQTEPDDRPQAAVDWQRITRWAEAIRAGDLADIPATFVRHGAAAPTLVWSPTVCDLRTAPLRHLLGHWSSLQDAGRLPSYRQIDPFDLRPALGYVMLIDTLVDSADFRYRLYGSALASISGADMTGRHLSELPASPYVREFSIAVGHAVMHRREAVYTARSPVGAQETVVWERLVLPLVNEEDRVTRFLVGSTPTGRDGQLIRAVY